MKELNVTLIGQTSLLMHSTGGIKVADLKHQSPRDQAEAGTYRTSEGKLGIPTTNILRAIVKGIGRFGPRGKGKKAAGSIIMLDEYAILDRQEFDVHTALVKVGTARIERYRAEIKTPWKCTVRLRYEDTIVSENELLKGFADTGLMVGLLDYRPECNGSFGRFTVKV